MKRISIILILLLFSATAHAAWTITAGIESATDFSDGSKMYRVKVACASDGSDPAEFNLSTYLAAGTTDPISGNTRTVDVWKRTLIGGYFYYVETDPGADAPDDTYTLAFDSDLGGSILDIAAASATVTELWNGSEDIGFYPVIYDLQIDIGDIGSSGDDIDIYIYIIR